LSRTRFDSAQRIVSRRFREGLGPDGAKVEFVIANRRSVVPHGVVGRDDDRAFIQIGLERALKEIAGIEEQNRAAIARPCRSQISDVSSEQRQASTAVGRQDTAMKVIRADD
jgi:hypothetical protein